MRSRLVSAAAVLAACLPAQQVLAPPVAAHGAIVAGKDGLVLPAGEFSVGELIEATAGFLCRNYLYDLDAVSRCSTFVLQRSIALDALGSEELLHALLSARSLVALPLDEQRGVYRIVDLALGPSLFATVPWRTPEEILRRPRLRELIVTALDVQQVDARRLAQAFQQEAVSQDPSRLPLVAAFAVDERLLLLRGYRDQLAQVVQAVRMLDRVGTAAPAADPLPTRIAALEREVAELKQALAARR